LQRLSEAHAPVRRAVDGGRRDHRRGYQRADGVRRPRARTPKATWALHEGWWVMAGTLPGTGMGGRLRDLYAEDETEVAKLRQARQDEDEMATSVGRWRAAQRLFGGKPEGAAPKISTATERLIEERT